MGREEEWSPRGRSLGFVAFQVTRYSMAAKKPPSSCVKRRSSC